MTTQGVGLEPLRAALAQGRACPVRAAPPGAGRELALPPAGWIEPLACPEAWTGRRSPRRLRLGRLDRLARLALVAAHHAVAAGGLPPADDDTAALALGTAYGSHLTNERFQLLLEQQGRAGASPALFTYTLPSSATGELSIHFALRGASSTFAQGETSGLAALAHAAAQLEQGRTSWALAGGADVLGPTLILALSDPLRGGCDAPLAEGAAFFTLSTSAAGALARIAGTAQGFGPGAAERVAARALVRAGVAPDELRARLTFGSERERGSAPLARCAGRALAALPLLGIGLHLAGGAAAALPALVVAADPQGAAVALCLAAPGGELRRRG